MGKKKSKLKAIDQNAMGVLVKKNDALQAGQKDLKKRWKQVRKQQKILTARYQSVMQQMVGLVEHVARLERENEKIRLRLAREAKVIKKIRGRLDRLKSREGSQRKQIKILEQITGGHVQRIKEFGERLAGVEQLAQQGLLLSEQIERLHEGKAELDAQIGKLISRIIGLESGKQETASSIGGLSGKLNELIRRQQEHLEKHQAIETVIESLNQTGSDLLQQADEQREQIKDLFKGLNKIEHALQEKVDALASKLSAAQERLSAKDTELENTAKRLDQEYRRLLEKELGRRQEQIRGLVESADALGSTLRENTELTRSLQEQAGDLKDNLVRLEERLASRDVEVEKAIQSLEAEHRQLAEENQSRQRRMMETWIEDLNRVESSVLQKVDHQRTAVEKLAGKTGRLEQTQNASTETNRLLKKQVGGFRNVLISAVKRLATSDAGLKKHSQELDLGLQDLVQRHQRLTRNALAGGVLLLALGGIGFWTLLNRLDHPPALLSEDLEQPGASKPIERPQQIAVSPDGPDQKLQRIERLEAAWEDLRNRLAVMESRQSEWQDAIEQHDEKLRLIEERLQSGLNQVEEQSKAAATLVVPKAVRDSAWLRSLDPKHYSIQILASHDAASVSGEAARQDLSAATAIYTRQGSGGDWYILLYGDFPSYRKATAALGSLPEDIRANDPWIRKLSSVQEELDN
ncbi:SPOR domain-containing protein [Thiolapillus sp.]